MKTPIYLDNNATTPIDPRVIEVMTDVLKNHFGNPASKTHSYGWYAEELVNIAREQVAELINAEPEEIIFTSGATEANNLAIQGLAKGNSSILSATTEHRSVLCPLEELDKPNVNIDLLETNPQGEIDLENYKTEISKNPYLVSLMMANNEIGTIHDIKTFSTLAKKHQAIFHTDATQAVGKIPVDVKELGVDLLSFSAHKIYGPKGVGALYLRKDFPRSLLQPQLFGGGHEKALRSGTLNVPGIVGFGKACTICKEEMSSDIGRIKILTDKLLNGLKESFPKLVLNGSPTKRIPGNLNIAFPGVSNSRLIGEIGSKIAISASSACASNRKDAPSYVLSALKLPQEIQNSSIRIGVGKFNTEEEIDFAITEITKVISELSKS